MLIIPQVAVFAIKSNQLGFPFNEMIKVLRSKEMISVSS